MTAAARATVGGRRPASTHTTHRFVALGHDFVVRSADGAFGRWLDRILAPLRLDGDPTSTYEHTVEGGSHRLRFVGDGADEVVVTTARPAVLLGYLMWHVNRLAVARAPRECVVVHAAGAVNGGVGILLPAPMDAGKTTLVAGLVRAGFGYLTDEAVAITAGSMLMQPFPRPLSLDSGSCAALADVAFDVPDEVAPYLDLARQVPVTGISGGAVAAPTRASLIIEPRYQPSARTRLESVPRAAMLHLMAEQTFGLRTHASEALRTLGDVVRGAACHRLTFSDLDTACRRVAGLVADIASAGRHG